MKIKKLNAVDLRNLINEALNEELSSIKEAHHEEKNELEEDAESDAAAEKLETGAEEEKIAIANESAAISESLQLERWKKLAGLLTD